MEERNWLRNFLVIGYCRVCGRPIYYGDPNNEYWECEDGKAIVHKNCFSEEDLKTFDCKDGKCNL